MINSITNTKSKFIILFKNILYVIIILLILLLLLEVCIRSTITYYPNSRFLVSQKGKYNLYKENLDIISNWGPIEYKLNTNEYGMRSAPVNSSSEKVFVIGQSVVDGFFVDNNETLSELLNIKCNNPKLQFLNISQGGSSFLEYAERVNRFNFLKPNIVIFQVSVSSFINSVESNILLKRLNNNVDLNQQKLNFKFFIDLLLTTATYEFITDLNIFFSKNKNDNLTNLFKKVMNKEFIQQPIILLSDSKLDFDGWKNFKEIGLFDKSQLNDEYSIIFDDYINKEKKIYLTNKIHQGLDNLQKLIDYSNSLGAKTYVIYYPSYYEVYRKEIGLEKHPSLFNSIKGTINNSVTINLDDYLSINRLKNSIHLAPINLHPNSNGYNDISNGLYNTYFKDLCSK